MHKGTQKDQSRKGEKKRINTSTQRPVPWVGKENEPHEEEHDLKECGPRRRFLGSTRGRNVGRCPDSHSTDDHAYRQEDL